MQNLTHLAVYMRLWLEQKNNPDTSKYQLDGYANWLVGIESGMDAQLILHHKPEQYRMAKWLKSQGLSQVNIAKLMEIQQPTVSNYMHRMSPKQQYRNPYIIHHLSQMYDEDKKHVRVPQNDV